MLTIKGFLQQVITCPEPGYFYLAVSNGSGWLEQWHHWPEDVDKIVERAEAQCKTSNVYFSTYLFKSTQATRDNILPTRTIQADLDDAELGSLPRDASILIETSPGRHQGYWILDRVLDLEQHEELSRKITYSIPMCDRSGWPLGRKVRLPSTFNHKYLSGPKAVTIIKAPLKKYTPEEFEDLPDVPRFIIEHFDEGFLENPDSTDEHPRELLERIREKIPSTVYITYDIQQSDRSAALYALMCYAFKAGLNRQEVFTLAKSSANNKFEDLRYRADQSLAKDVLRAELTVNSTTTDAKQLIRDLFKSSLAVLDRKKQISSVVLDSLKNQGVFIRAARGFTWYIRRDSGKPIQVTAHSQDLFNLLDLQFGLNFTEPETRYVAYSLQAFTDNLPPTGYQSALAHYDLEEKHLLLHTGRKGVIRVTAQGTERVINGAYEVVFPWASSVEEFVPTRAPENTKPTDWGDELFGDGERGFGSSVKNLTNLSPEEGMALLKVWFIFVLFRNAASARPVIAMFGQPGCVSGETEILYRRGDSSKSTYLKPISEVYRQSKEAWFDRATTQMQSEKDGVVAWRNVAGFVYSGKKKTYTVSIAGTHGPVRVTEDHRFLTPGGYKTLQQLSVGDEVLIRGEPLTGLGSKHTLRQRVQANFHPYAWEYYAIRNGKKNGPYRRMRQARASVDAALNNMSLEQFLQVVNTDEALSAQLKYTDKDAHIHHIDGDTLNDDPSNLEVMLKREHGKMHSSDNQRNLGGFSGLYEIVKATVDGITPYGIEDTYDIQMADEEAPNFVVSGAILHNSGKSTAFKKVFTILYGRHKSIGAVTSMDDFDHVVSTDPLVVLDNVDTWEKWLPDRIALSAGTSDIVKRQLYTDSSSVTLKRQAVVGLTAHNPQFNREDVADRFLLFAFKRFPHFVSEERIHSDLYLKRNLIWGAVLDDVQRVLATPQPQASEAPQFRIEDFALLGLWIARGIGCEAAFRASIGDVKSSQQNLNLEEEGMLVNAAIKFAITQTKRVEGPQFYVTAEVWNMLVACCDDERAFLLRYKNAVALSKKLSSMQDSLTKVIDIKQQQNEAGVKIWRFATKAK